MGFIDDIIGGNASIGGALQTFQTVMIGVLIFIVAAVVVGFVVVRKKINKQYNIPLIIVTPRSDGRVVEISRGVGGYFGANKVGGITSFRVKRKGIATVDIPPPESSFLTSPDRTLILAQKGVGDYEPVLPESLDMIMCGDKKERAILQLRAKNQEATAWAFDNEESAKRRFTFASFWDKWNSLITMMTFIFILFLILYIQWIGMKDVVTGLKEVADVLKHTATPIITSGG